MAIISVLCIGDVVGVPGRAIFQKYAQRLKKDFSCDAVIVNGENAAHDGRGITPKIMGFFKHAGADLVTSGNHIFAKREIYQYLSAHTDLLRPINFPGACPGVGIGFIQVPQGLVAVINVQGRVFMREHVACPFKAVESALTFVKSKTAAIIIDMHAETSSEKMGLALYNNGKISLLYGTHTHVQTADERIFPQGTAFITDIGMCGALNSMIGMKATPIIESLITQMPHRFEVETNGPLLLSGIVVRIESETGKAISIERIRIIDDTLSVTPEDDEYDAPRPRKASL
jgi:metallophosphoesterase (TIGR00282 family)